MTQPNDEASLKGKGKEILLPAQGDPFAARDEAASESATASAEAVSEEVSFEAPVMESAQPEAALESGPSDQEVAASLAGTEVRDLTPEDIAQLFPGASPAFVESYAVVSPDAPSFEVLQMEAAPPSPAEVEVFREPPEETFPQAEVADFSAPAVPDEMRPAELSFVMMETPEAPLASAPEPADTGAIDFDTLFGSSSDSSGTAPAEPSFAGQETLAQAPTPSAAQPEGAVVDFNSRLAAEMAPAEMSFTVVETLTELPASAFPEGGTMPPSDSTHVDFNSMSTGAPGGGRPSPEPSLPEGRSLDAIEAEIAARSGGAMAGDVASADFSEAEPGAPSTVAVSAAAVVAPSVSAAVEAGSGAAPTSETPTSVTAVAATAVAAGGAEAGASARIAASTALQLSEEVGLPLTAYQRAQDLQSQQQLLDMFVTDVSLMALWQEIAKLETEVTTNVRGLSQTVADELIDRLRTARNMLLHDRDRYEDASREVAAVKYRLTRIRTSGYSQQPRPILAYLLFVLPILILGFAAANPVWVLLGSPTEVAGTAFPTLWNTIMWGGLGGLSAALWGLWRHVAQKHDYDPQHAQWYYLSPIMGLIFGPLVALFAQIGLPAFFDLASQQSSSIAIDPIVLYILAWVVGFQQNLLLQLINNVLKRISPEEGGKGKG